MPVAFVSTDGGRRFAPVAPERFCIGSDPARDLVERDAGLALRQAEVRYLDGEYRLSATEDGEVEVNGRAVQGTALRDGDTLRFATEGRAWRFRNRMQGSLRRPGASLAAAWIAHPAFTEASHGPEQFGRGGGIGGRDPARCRRVRGLRGSDALVVKRLAAAHSVEEADHFLHLLTAVGGAPHPALAALVDGGLTPGRASEPQRWFATRWVEGETVAALMERGEVEVSQLLPILRSLATGLAHLHARGVVHRDVAPGNAVVEPSGQAVLIDFGQALVARLGLRPSRGVVGTPGYVAPEEVLAGPAAATPASDWYGWAAVGYALATGRPPAQGNDVLERLAGATLVPPSPAEFGVDLPPHLETVLMQALSVEPAVRPDARALLTALDEVSEAPGRSRGRSPA